MTFKDDLERQLDEEHPKDSYVGPDWWQLTPEEELVFSIDRERWPRMMTAWYFYEMFLGIAHGEEVAPDIVKAEQKQRADIFELGKSLRGFSAFAVEYAGLTMREVHAVYAKMDFWNVRAGVTSYKDEG